MRENPYSKDLNLQDSSNFVKKREHWEQIEVSIDKKKYIKNISKIDETLKNLKEKHICSVKEMEMPNDRIRISVSILSQSGWSLEILNALQRFKRRIEEL